MTRQKLTLTCPDCNQVRVVSQPTNLSRRDLNPPCRACANARRTRDRWAARTDVKATAHPLYVAHSGMKQRCCNPNHGAWRYYGGKGIAVCDEWLSFQPFLAWALANGWQPGLTIDRVDSSRGYCPENCEWVTPAENSRRAVIVREQNRGNKKCPTPAQCHPPSTPSARSTSRKSG